MRAQTAVGPALMFAALLGWWGVGSCKSETTSSSEGGIARQITSPDALVNGPEAAGRVGDYVLDNGQVRFIVQSPESSTGWSLYGGSLVDAAAVTAEGASPDLLEEIFVQCDLRGFRPRTAEIVSGGGPDAPGILRLVGSDAGIPFLDAILPRDPLDVTITVDFTLPPDGRTLDLEIAAKDERKRGRRELSCGLLLLPGDAHRLFVPRRGFTDEVGGGHPYLAAEGEGGGSSYLLQTAGPEPLEVLLSGLPFLPIGPAAQPFLANATLRAHYRLTVGADGGIESARAAAGLPPPERGAPRALELSLTGAEVSALRAASVLFEDAEAVEGRGAVTAAVPGADGVVRAALPPGRYRVAVSTRDLDTPLADFELTIAPGNGPHAETQALSTLGGVALRTVELGLDGAEVGPTPARVRIVAGAQASPSGAPIYEAYVEAEHRFSLPAGEYTAVVSRGPEHERFVTDLEVTAGAEASIEARVQRVVNRAGWVSADLHVHGVRSTDSTVAKRSRVLGAAAEGVDVLVSTDHDAITDYAPVVEALGLGAQLRTVAGTEMSPLYGHINGFPLTASAPEDHWRPGWFVYGDDGRFERVLEPDEVVEALRGAGAEVVQFNHPRGSQHLFGYIGLDPATGQTESVWPAPDAFELLNGKRLDDYPAVFADLHGLLRAGRRVTATGTSDVHSEFGVGYARTYVRVPDAGALADLDLSAVWTSLREGRAVAASGPFVTLVASRGGERAEVGETLAGAGPAQIEVRVQAPSWITPTQVRVFERDQVLLEREITPADADPAQPALRFTGTVTATVASETYFMVEVRGEGGQPNVREVLTVTNPVFATP